MPAVMMEGFLLSKDATEVRLANYEIYNEKCRQDLQQMNETLIDNLIARGGTEGWSTEGDLDALSKTFQFDTFEKSNQFIHGVGVFAESKDHHPEWSIVNGGKDVTVRLTSHFANNKVTLFDFELAEAMNKEFKSSLKYNMFPRYTQTQYYSVGIALASTVILLGTYHFLTSYRFITDITSITYRNAPLHQLEGESYENHSGHKTTTPFKYQRKLFP